MKDIRTVTLSLNEVVATSGEELRELALTRLMGEHTVTCELPTRSGEFVAVAHCAAPNGDVTVALVHGRPDATSPVHTHVGCLLGDTFGSLLCNCRHEFDRATADIQAAGAGMLVYVKTAAVDAFACPAGRQVEPELLQVLIASVRGPDPLSERAA